MRTIFDELYCCLVRTWLVPRAEGSVVPVPAPVLGWINGHLDGCARCRVELKNLRLTTFALRKSGLHRSLKSVDPSFADRVIARVQRGEEMRRRRAAQLRTSIAAASAAATFVVMFGWLGGFTVLLAQWSPIFHSPAAVPAVVTTPPPYAEHDPFGAATAALQPGDVYGPEGLSDSDKQSEAHVQTSQIKRPIPDLLSHLHADLAAPAKPAQETAPVQDADNQTPSPALAASSYQQQDQRTPPPIIGSGGSSSGLSIVAPPPSDPGSSGIQAASPATAPQTTQPATPSSPASTPSDSADSSITGSEAPNPSPTSVKDVIIRYPEVEEEK